MQALTGMAVPCVLHVALLAQLLFLSALRISSMIGEQDDCGPGECGPADWSGASNAQSMFIATKILDFAVRLLISVYRTDSVPHKPTVSAKRIMISSPAVWHQDAKQNLRHSPCVYLPWLCARASRA